MALNIRLAGPADAGLIHRLVLELATFEGEPNAVESTPESLRAQMASPRPPFECLLAEWEGTPAGCALFFQSYSSWKGRPGMWLDDLFVLPDYRSKGIGKALLARCAQLCAERGYGRFEWVVLDWNQKAIKFYDALKANPLDQWKIYRLEGQALQDLANS